ncbi:MAG: transketolase, partial [Candidatus Omnitrophica bacterium]|nr:transketolase [Candidatus Omnitrophota bacterium]
DNRISSITNTAEVINLLPLKDRFAGFGLRVYEVDGHDVEAIIEAIDDIKRIREVSVIICRTTKGYGVPFAEGEPIWHYRTLNEQDYRAAMAYLEQGQI